MICTGCKNEKDEEEFHFKDQTKIKRHTECKSCQKVRANSHYLIHKKRYKEDARKRRIEFRNWFNKFKSTLKCKECGENHIAVLDFHHLDPTKKEKGITNLVASNSRTKLELELKKCIVLCSNCHRKLHWKEKQGQIPNVE
jgi:hypothetical protein